MGIKITGDKELSQMFANATKKINNWNSAIEKILGFLKRDAKANFAKQGYLFQKGGWNKLTPRTQDDRQRRGFNPKRPVLVRTGNLKGGFITKGQRMSGTIYNDVKYARYHQDGTRKMPQRTILDTRRETEVFIEHTVVNFLKEVFA